MMQKKILIIEEEQSVASVHWEFLTQNGFLVSHVSSRKEVLSELNDDKKRVDLLLIKIGTGNAGFETAKEIQTRDSIPTLFLISDDIIGLDEKWQNLSCFGILSQDVSTSVLIASINMALRQHVRFLEQQTKMKVLEEKSNLIESILDCSGDFIFVKDRELRTILCNEMVAKSVGRTRKELYGHNDLENGAALELVKGNPAKGIRGWEEDDKEALSGKIVRNSSDYVYTDGKVHIYDSIKRPLRNEENEIIGILGISRDITEQRRSEELLKESETKYRSLFNEMTNGLALHEVILDADGLPIDYKLLSINPAFETIIGKNRELLIGKSVNEVMPALYAERFYEYGNVALNGKSIKFESFIQELGKYISTIVYSYQKGFFATIIEDITENKKFELELQDTIKSRNLLLKEFQHRVKNNLISISMLLGIQLDHLSENNEARRAILNSKLRINSISAIYDQLTYSDNLEKVDLQLYIKDIVKSTLDTFTTGNVEMHFLESSESIELDLSQTIPLGLIINELLTNAIKYAYPKDKKGAVQIHIEKSGERLTIGIFDDGIGLPPEFKLEEATSMGLNLVYLLAGQLGASLEMINQNGTKFSLQMKLDS